MFQKHADKKENGTKEEKEAAGQRSGEKDQAPAGHAGHSHGTRDHVKDLESRLAEITQELENKKDESDKNLELAKRIKAEFENYKKRVNKDYEENIKLANEDLMTELFPVVHLFENALKAHGDEDAKFKSFHSGIELLWKELKKVLEKNGLVEIAPEKGAKFDPSECEAVLVEESDKHREDVVLELLEKGCRISNKLIKPARVKVGKPAKHAPDEGTREPDSTSPKD
jgi:molecular chaperone GrpE